MKYQLDSHGEMLLSQFKEKKPVFQRMEQIAIEQLEKAFSQQGLYVTAIEHRVKNEQSLAGKLELKGSKYKSMDDITDLLGIRVITFYTDDVDKVAAIAKSLFDVDWKNSVDKRKMHDLRSFGYNSLHYICSLPKTLVDDASMPELNEYRFELQMRTALQHVWSTLEHDIGYKGIKVPKPYLRQFSRLAGMLELIDDEFSRLRTSVADYRRNIQSLEVSGRLNEIPLTKESFRNYLYLRPFDRLNRRIAAVNQAEIVPAPVMPFLRVFENFGFETLGDVSHFIDANEDDAYELALAQLALTDLDILSETVGAQNLCIVYALKEGQGRRDLMEIFNVLNGPDEGNGFIVDSLLELSSNMSFLNKK